MTSEPNNQDLTVRHARQAIADIDREIVRLQARREVFGRFLAMMEQATSPQARHHRRPGPRQRWSPEESRRIALAQLTQPQVREILARVTEHFRPGEEFNLDRFEVETDHHYDRGSVSSVLGTLVRADKLERVGSARSGRYRRPADGGEELSRRIKAATSA